jgi:hypothetical protein
VHAAATTQAISVELRAWQRDRALLSEATPQLPTRLGPLQAWQGCQGAAPGRRVERNRAAPGRGPAASQLLYWRSSLPHPHSGPTCSHMLVLTGNTFLGGYFCCFGGCCAQTEAGGGHPDSLPHTNARPAETNWASSERGMQRTSCAVVKRQSHCVTTFQSLPLLKHTHTHTLALAMAGTPACGADLPEGTAVIATQLTVTPPHISHNAMQDYRPGRKGSRCTVAATGHPLRSCRSAASTPQPECQSTPTPTLIDCSNCQDPMFGQLFLGGVILCFGCRLHMNTTQYSLKLLLAGHAFFCFFLLTCVWPAQ